MKYITIIGIGFFMVSQIACKKFLEETSPSIIIPTQTAHYLELLNGEGYPNSSTGTGYQNFSELLTDDVEWGHLPYINPIYAAMKEYSSKNGWGAYLFIDDPESVSGNGTDTHWGNMYKSIVVCNMVISGLKETLDNDQALKKKLTGQAYALRALSYLSLMNIYGMPYVKNKDSELGVPIKLTSVAEDRAYTRSSVHKVYNMIKSDIDSALTYLDPGTSIKLYEMNWYAAMILATRINLYMENYDEVIRLGEAYLTRKSEMATPAQALSGGLFMGYTASQSGISNNPEVVFNYGSAPSTFNGIYQGNTVADYFTPSIALKSLYKKGLKTGESDQRMTNPDGVTASWFFAAPSSIYVPRKIFNNNTRNNTLRTSEVLLNLAEAFVAKSNIPKALSHLNALRGARIKNYTNFNASDFDINSLKTFTAEERRRELCFEEHRLPDLKRYGMPAMTHYIQDFTGKYKVTIEQGDPGYIFQIPLKERDINADIKRIPRPLRTVEAY